jgi:Protein of unknown function (DUF3142)
MALKAAVTAAVVLGASAMSGDRAYGRRGSPMDVLPRQVLWAWERPEDLRSRMEAAGDRAPAVAYLAGTVRLRASGPEWTPRRQPLRVLDQTRLIAVTRIQPDFDWRSETAAEAIAGIAARLAASARAPRVRAIQIDFDATVSQRVFYRALVEETRRRLPPGVPLSITALASWCTEAWLDEWPIDEAVPMLFEMGPRDARFRELGDRGMWRAARCRDAIGLSTEEPQAPARGRRVYLFNPKGWDAR